MTKELFVTSTPHETKVGLVEDDQLAEIYLERENEYTLAGSIYKGRVTRVLPGMQSAFVDIGLERDAFLYVSDFMELEDQDDDLNEVVPTNRPPLQESRSQESRPQPQRSEAPAPTATENASYVIESEPFEEESSTAPAAETSTLETSNHEAPSREAQPRDRGSFRSRRRRRGRRFEDDRNDRDRSENRFNRTDTAESQPSASQVQSKFRSRAAEYGPPPGYQPMILPGESISKYRGRAGQPPVPANQADIQSSPPVPEAQPASVASNFPDDEPLFATGLTEPLHEQHGDFDRQDEAAHQEWEREHALQERMNLTAAFSPEPVHDHEELAPDVIHAAEPQPESQPEPQAFASAHVESPAEPATSFGGPAGTVEEQVIEEEETDLTHYVEDLEEDAVFEEMEEETSAAEDYQSPRTLEIAATGEPPSSPSAGSEAAPVAEEVATAVSGESFTADGEAEEAEEENVEAEIEDAQAEAEALLDAEARGNGTVDARVEVRAPATTAAYTQRAQRPSFDRRRGRRGGRRFRSGGGGAPRRENTSVPLISDLLKEGQEVLIQIAKEPIGKKGARITSHIALPGRFLVYMPTVNHTGVSRKISSDEERQRLKRIIISERENGQGGFIVRTAAAGASEEDLRADIRFLKNLWHEIKTRSEEAKAPALIYHDLNVVERVLRDQVTSDFSAIWVDTEQEYERILRFANRFQPALVRRVKLYTKETPLFEQFGLKEEIDKALKSKVWLKSGGYIVINQTEALVAIDINTGKYVGKTARLEDTIVKTNVDAIKEIVRQIRLRDLGGIIVIDFIDMDERRNRQRVMQALEEELRNDRAPSKVLQFNDFGLVAITRKRVKQSLERTIGSPCPHCEATGFVKSVTTICNEIYVEMRKMAKHMERQDILLRVHPEVAKALKAQNGRWLTEMEELTKRTIIIKSDASLHEEQFDIN
jgi:Rne/Rng family ribonuclease